MNQLAIEISKKRTLVNSGILMCILGIAFFYYEYYLRVAPSVIRPELKETYHLTEAGFGGLAAYYFYAYTPLQLPVGLLIDRFGVRLILSLACLMCASSICVFASGLNLMLAKLSWFALGMGSAFAYVGVLKIADAELPKKYFSLVAGICSAFGMFGGISGALIMTHCVGALGWQSTLYYSGMVGFILSIVLWIVLQNKSENYHDACHHKMIPLLGLKDILLSKQMWINGVIGCLTFLPVSIFSGIWAVTFLEGVGFDKSSAAIGSSLIFFGFAIGGPLWGFVCNIVQSHRKILILGSFSSAILMGIVIWFPSTNVWIMYSLLLLSSIFASAQIMVFSVSNMLCHSSVSATAAAFTNMIGMIGGIFLPQVIGWLLDNSHLIGSNDTSEKFSCVFSILPLGLMVAGILSLSIKETFSK